LECARIAAALDWAFAVTNTRLVYSGVQWKAAASRRTPKRKRQISTRRGTEDRIYDSVERESESGDLSPHSKLLWVED
jgi:hypothetical protein